MSRERTRDRTKKSKPAKITTAGKGGQLYYEPNSLRTETATTPDVAVDYGKNEVVKSISLGYYWDVDKNKWRKLESANIATSQTKAKFYAVEPAEITETDWADMRVDATHRLMVNNVINPSYIVKQETDDSTGFLFGVSFAPSEWEGDLLIKSYKAIVYNAGASITGIVEYQEKYGEYAYSPAERTDTLATTAMQTFMHQTLCSELSVLCSGNMDGGQTVSMTVIIELQ